jgi:hypothetical protein
MNQTVFQVYGEQHRGSGYFWKIIIVVTLILVVGVYTLTDGKYIALGPSPLLILIIWLATRNKKDGIKVFVNQQKTDFEFGYYDKDNKMHGPFPITEYTYWAHERSATTGGWNIDLYFQINSNNATVYFKQSMVAKTAPPNWTRSAQSFPDNNGAVFLVPDLTKLAAIVDGIVVDDSVEVQQ